MYESVAKLPCGEVTVAKLPCSEVTGNLTDFEARATAFVACWSLPLLEFKVLFRCWQCKFLTNESVAKLP